MGFESPGKPARLGRKLSIGVGGRVSGERPGAIEGGGGWEARCGGCEGRVAWTSGMEGAFARLYSRQHVGQRHSTMRLPASSL
jgi:hypothetical protein